ncbi:MAG: hypothetical protein MUD14_30580 [Hydrococcus sp. Prado102]|jgi:hypothetical protein|nr:hypothetical protein [Hydrococcus sp. Prado102]
MAKLSDELLNRIFTLQRQLARQIETASAIEWQLLDRYGETEETIAELNELYSVREKLTERFTGLNNILLRILEIQPVAQRAMLDLLIQTIERTQENLDAAEASIKEVKGNWNLS